MAARRRLDFVVCMSRKTSKWMRLDHPDIVTLLQMVLSHHRGTWWRIGRVEAFRPEGCGFECHSSRHVGTLALTRWSMWRFGVKLRHSIRAVSGALLSSSLSSGLEEALYNGLHE